MSTQKTVLNHSTVKQQSDNQVRCEICSVTVTSEICYQLHLEGRKHKKFQQAQLLKNPNYCSPTFEELRNQRSISTNEPLSADESISATPVSYNCHLCDIVCKSEKAYTDHLHGRKHIVTSKRKQPCSMEETVNNPSVNETAPKVVISDSSGVNKETNSMAEERETLRHLNSKSNCPVVDNDTVEYVSDVTPSLGLESIEKALADEIHHEQQASAQTQQSFQLESDINAIQHPSKRTRRVIPEHANQSRTKNSRKPMRHKMPNSFANSNQRNEDSFRSNRVANSRTHSSRHDFSQQAAPNSFSSMQHRATDSYRNHHSTASSDYYQTPSIYQNQFSYPNSLPINYQGQTSNSNNYSSNQGLHSNYEYNYVSSYSSTNSVTDNPFNYPNNAYQ